MATEFDNSLHWGLFLTGTTLTSETGKYVRVSELVLSALRAAGVFSNMVDGIVAPTTDKLWLDKNFDPAVLKEWDATGASWVPMTYGRLFGRAAVDKLTVTGGTGNAVVVSQPVGFQANRLYLMTPTADNSAATTITVSGVGTYAVNYGNGADIGTTEFTAGRQAVLFFTGSRFEVVFPLNTLSSAVLAAQNAAAAAIAAKEAAETAAATFLVLDEDDFSSDSATRPPSQQSTKAFVVNGRREKLTADRTYYVRNDGSDSNAGLANTSGAAFLTIQRAIDIAMSLDTRGFSVTIQCADGARTTGSIVPRALVGGGTLTILGNTTTPANCPVTVTGADCFGVYDGANVSIRGFKMSTLSVDKRCIYATNRAVVTHGFNDFGSCGGIHIDMGNYALVVGLWNYTISGSAIAHWHTGVPAVIDTLGITITLTGTPNFSSYFAGSAGGYIRFINVTFSGAATGRRYYVHKGGVIDGMGAAESALPGNSAGERYTGGQYVGDGSTVFMTKAAFNIPAWVRCVEDGANPGPYFVVDRESLSPAANDQIGAVMLTGRNSALSLTFYGYMDGVISNPTAGAEAGMLRWRTMQAGADGVRVNVGAGLYMPGAVGGDKGVGTINATEVYNDNVALTCMALATEFREHGMIDLAKWDAMMPEGREHRTARLFKAMCDDGFDPRDPEQYFARITANEALPGMPSQREWSHNEIGQGEIVSRQWLATEMLAIVSHAMWAKLKDVDRRLAILEAKLLV